MPIRSKAHHAVASALTKVGALLIALCVAACGSLPPPVDIFKHENGGDGGGGGGGGGGGMH
jgi:hypothetical protein